MDAATIQAMYPHLTGERLDRAVELATAAVPLKDEIERIERAEARTLLLQQWSRLLNASVQMVALTRPVS